jgi:RNA polymerase sigma factor (sigma-70 family)
MDSQPQTLRSDLTRWNLQPATGALRQRYRARLWMRVLDAAGSASVDRRQTGSRLGKDSPDAILLAALRASPPDPNALMWLYDRYYPGLFGFAKRQLWKEEDAEEAVQDVFWKLFQHPERVSGSLVGFLYKLLRDRIVDEQRRRIRARLYSEDVEVACEREAVTALLLRRDIARLIAILPAIDQDILLLTNRGEDGEQISTKVGISHSAVRQRLRRARKKLQAMWEEE